MNGWVSSFYEKLRFNFRQTVEAHVSRIKSATPIDVYPVLQHVMCEEETQIMEIGCGVEGYSNSIAYHHSCCILSIDFNRVSIQRLREVLYFWGLRSNLKRQFYLNL